MDSMYFCSSLVPSTIKGINTGLLQYNNHTVSNWLQLPIDVNNKTISLVTKPNLGDWFTILSRKHHLAPPFLFIIKINQSISISTSINTRLFDWFPEELLFTAMGLTWEVRGMWYLYQDCLNEVSLHWGSMERSDKASPSAGTVKHKTPEE